MQDDAIILEVLRSWNRYLFGAQGKYRVVCIVLTWIH